MSASISFDRAADYYDQTRGLPDHLMAQLVAALVAELPRRGRCLEIGIGTGRIALPLMEHGVDVVGVDISVEMLRRLRAKSGGREMRIAIADATRLPFADRTFTSAIASHVLHLIPEWKVALEELERVVEPGGVLLASRSANAHAEWQRAVRRHFFDAAGNPEWPPGMSRIDDLDAEMRRRGAEVRVVRDIHNEELVSISELLAALEMGIWSACWAVDEETRRRAARETREWATKEFGDLDAKRPTRHESDWRAYRLAQ
ncbi:MAG TPA: class I SAM-dependent methyltransferase [Candidatus Dormibacteraeota bacterium]|nr:class I SAM-dependent methyltransferase [Candidatus Dormibacteraeota bacterium]